MAETITMPKLGFDMAEGTLVRWIKTEGDSIGKGEVLAEIETDKATVEVESSVGGIVYRRLVEEGTVVPVGTPIAIVSAPGEEVKGIPESGLPQESEPEVATLPAKQEARSDQKPQAIEKPEASVDGNEEEGGKRIKASPLAKRIAREEQLDLTRIEGSGPGGRIVRRDIEVALQVAERRSSVSEPSSPGLPPIPVFQEGVLAAADESVAVGKLRAAIGRRMVESKQRLPHFYVTHEYDMESIMALRKQINASLPEEEKLSVNDFIVKAAALGLREYPNLNASLSDDKIIWHGGIHIGVAVAVEGGLLTVVVRNADLKPLRLISREVKEMVVRVRQGKVRPEDIEGSTFSISNLGMFDVDHFVAIINPPEAAILATGSVKQVPVVMDGVVQARLRMKATLSADHRVTDGAEVAQYLQTMKRYMEEALLLLI